MPRAMHARRIGLARALSKLGYCSRSNAAELIRAGHVRLNGEVRRDPERPVNLGKDRIQVDGADIAAEAKIYLMLNKPRGVVTTASDEKGRKTVLDCLGRKLAYVAPVGRLDKASEGLLLLTNDSEWAARTLDRNTHLPKTYHVQISAVANDGLLQRLQKGVVCDDEFMYARSASIVRVGEKNSWIEIALDEGKNRQIRRMLEELRIEVLRLIRIAIGPLALGNLPKGGSRMLTVHEKHVLDAAMLGDRR